jgi:IS5 family transposase
VNHGAVIFGACVLYSIHPNQSRPQFGFVKARFRGLAKNTAHVVTLFALSNLWMARKQLMAMTGVVRPKGA